MKIFVESKLLGDPKMLALAEHMGWDKDTCVGKLVRFWLWCIDQTETGNLSAYSAEDIARAIDCASKDGEKLLRGMMLNPRDAFLFHAEGALHVRSWWKYTGRYWLSKYQKSYAYKADAIRAYCERIESVAGNHTITPPKPDNNPPETPAPAKARPASVAEVKEYGAEIGVSADECEKFWLHYEANGWVQNGKKPIKNWRAAFGGWKKRIGLFTNGNGTTQKPVAGSQHARATFEHTEEDITRLREVAASIEIQRANSDKRA